MSPTAHLESIASIVAATVFRPGGPRFPRPTQRTPVDQSSVILIRTRAEPGFVVIDFAGFRGTAMIFISITTSLLGRQKYLTENSNSQKVRKFVPSASSKRKPSSVTWNPGISRLMRRTRGDGNNSESAPKPRCRLGKPGEGVQKGAFGPNMRPPRCSS